MLNYVCDFETTSYEQYIKDGETRVFLWAVCEINEEKNYPIVAKGTEIESFIKWATSKHGDKTVRVYFHNLRFDGSFILNYLLNNGYKVVERFSDNPNKEVIPLISDMGVWYSLKLRYKINKGIYNISFLDSAKKIPLKVKDIAKTYNLEILKGDFDYTKYREKDYIPTQEEWEYVFNDVKIVAQALNHHFKDDMKKLTISSDAYSDFMSYFTKSERRLYYPILDLNMWTDIRKAYRGGWVISRKEHNQNLYKNVLSYDVNSLYPYAMYSLPLPYSVPVKFKGKYKHVASHPLYIQYIQTSFKVKDGYLPTIQSTSLGRYRDDLFILDTDNEVVELALTSVDLELFKKHHDIYYIKYLYGYMFRASTYLFKDYIDKWNGVKEVSTGGQRNIAKLMLNSLYGKFGADPRTKNKKPYLSFNGLGFETTDERVSKWTKYLPIAVFTTANARKVIIETSQLFYDNHLYSDTDSMKLYNITPEEVSKLIEVDPVKLGAFKLEDIYHEYKQLKPKHYAYTLFKGDKINVVASGLPKEVRATINDFDTFDIGFKSESKLILRQVKGGAVLIPSMHEIK